jgi:transposase-like protein
MQLHANAALSLKRRAAMVREVVERDRSIAEAAAAAGVSPRTCRKWVTRFRADGQLGLLDRSSAPQHVANRTAERRIAVIAALRRLRMTGPEIAEVLDMPLSTVSGILTRIGLGKLGRLGLEAAVRYERQRPGELIHIDVKKLGRIARPGHRVLGRQSAGGHHQNRYHHGWEYVHVAVDDATRLAYVEVLDDEKAVTAIAFLRTAVAFFARHGVTVERVLTDNGSATARRSTRSPVASWESGTCARGPIARRPMARRSDSSARCWAAGPTARSTAPAASAPRPLTAGSTTTTIAANTQPSATSPRSLASTSEPTCSGLTPSRRSARRPRGCPPRPGA